MEEGLEPHEVLERTIEHKHHQEEPHRGTLAGAVIAACLSVLAALGSLLSGDAANHAILAQSKASDQWAYYQSKSTKGHLYDVSKQVVLLLSARKDTPPDKIEKTLKRFDSQIEKYDKEKKEVEQEASLLEKESRLELHKHEKYASAISLFQVGIVLASVSILVGYRWLLFSSMIAGVSGIGLLIIGWMT